MSRGKLGDRVTLGPARRRRQMHARLRALDRLDAGASGADRRDWLRTAFVAVVTTAVLLVAASVMLSRHYGVTLSAHGISHRQPLGRPPAALPTGGSFAFAQHQPGRPGTPVAYDPCRTLHVVVNSDLAPAGSDGLVSEAISRVGLATGLDFAADGHTHDLPDRDGNRRAGAGLTPRTPPILVAWTTPAQVTGLRGRVAGLGGSAAVGDGPVGERHYVTGTVSLDTPTLARTLTFPHGRALVRAVLMHELGHVVGLAHVRDPNELMNATNAGRTTFGPGDLQGLAALGSGRCFGS